MVRLVRAGHADQPGPKQWVQALTPKERTVREPGLPHEVGLLARYFAPRDDRALIVGQVGQRGSDQVGVRSARLVTDQALGSLWDLVTRRLTKRCSVEATLDVFGKGIYTNAMSLLAGRDLFKSLHRVTTWISTTSISTFERCSEKCSD